MSSYPRYSSSYRVTRESSGPGGINYYSSSYATPSLYTPGRTYHSSYMVPSVRTHTYSVPSRSTYTSYRPSYSSYVPRWLPANPYLPAEIWADGLTTVDPPLLSCSPAPLYRLPPRRHISMPPEYRPASERVSTLLTPSTQRKIRELHEECSAALASSSQFDREHWTDRVISTDSQRGVPSHTCSNPTKAGNYRSRNPALPEWKPRHKSDTLGSCDMNPVRLNIAIMSYFDRAKELADYDSKRTVNMLDESSNTRRTADFSIDRTEAAPPSTRDDFFSAQSELAENSQHDQAEQQPNKEAVLKPSLEPNHHIDLENDQEKEEEQGVKDDDTIHLNDVTAVNDDISQSASIANSEIDAYAMNESHAKNSLVNDTEDSTEPEQKTEAEMDHTIDGNNEQELDDSHLQQQKAVDESETSLHMEEEAEEDITVQDKPDEGEEENSK